MTLSQNIISGISQLNNKIPKIINFKTIILGMAFSTILASLKVESALAIRRPIEQSHSTSSTTFYFNGKIAINTLIYNIFTETDNQLILDSNPDQNLGEFINSVSSSFTTIEIDSLTNSIISATSTFSVGNLITELISEESIGYRLEFFNESSISLILSLSDIIDEPIFENKPFNSSLAINNLSYILENDLLGKSQIQYSNSSGILLSQIFRDSSEQPPMFLGEREIIKSSEIISIPESNNHVSLLILSFLTIGLLTKINSSKTKF